MFYWFLLLFMSIWIISSFSKILLWSRFYHAQDFTDVAHLGGGAQRQYADRALPPVPYRLYSTLMIWEIA